MSTHRVNVGQAKAMDRARSRRTPAGTSEQATSKVYAATSAKPCFGKSTHSIFCSPNQPCNRSRGHVLSAHKESVKTCPETQTLTCQHLLAAQRAPDAECSEDLISAIVHMCHVVGGPASGITREEAIAAATFKDELRTYK